MLSKNSQKALILLELEATGLWPKRFAPATMTVDELHSIAEKERLLHSHLHRAL